MNRKVRSMLIDTSGARRLRNAVPSYKVLVFSSSQLIRWETREADDDIADVNAEPVYGEAGKVEVWRNDRRLEKIKGVGRSRGGL